MPKRFKIVSLYVALLLCLPALCFAWQGKVVGVSDGDTISVMNEGRGEKIRLYGVDSPESDQDFGTKAKQFTSDMVYNKVVEIVPVDRDDYGRTVGVVLINGKTLNEELVRNGMAWVYDQYCKQKECGAWDKLEAQARETKVGLWSVPNPIPPWEFRHPKKGQNQSQVETTGGLITGILRLKSSTQRLQALQLQALYGEL